MNQTRKKLFLTGFQFDKMTNYLYRPFDLRNIYYEGSIIARDVREIMKNLLKPNIALNIVRQFYEEQFCHVFISDCISDINYLTSARGQYVFPIYLIQDAQKNNNEKGFLFNEKGKTDNFTKEFCQYIITKYNGKYSPELVLGYIYSILHSQTYRNKYFDFLKIDFPRIPFTDNEDLFKELSAIGFELIEHHLLNKSYTDNICKMGGIGNNDKVEKVEYEKGKVWINKERYFEPIPEPIWNFYIGGYQVLDKWLKERKKHEITLSSDDIQHFIKVVNVLDYTIKTMQKIDEKTREWI
jgi:predicted helicase